MNIRRSVVTLIGSAALMTGGLFTAPAAAAETADSEQVSRLLSEAKTAAYQLREDAAAMETYTRTDVSWEAHADAINQIKEHIGALARVTAKLQSVKSAASPWQKTAIDRINPYLDELGGYTSAAIEHINGNHSAHTMLEYKDYLEANADYASDLAAMIGNFVDYGRAKQRMDRLGGKLEVRTEK